MIFTPSVLDGFRLSIDYSEIRKTNEIQSPSSQFILDNESVFPNRVVRGAKLPGDPADWPGQITMLDMTLLNIAKSKVQALDMQVSYSKKTAGAGTIEAYAVGTYLAHYYNQQFPGFPNIDRVGYSGSPLRWRGNAGLTWKIRRFTFEWNVQFYPSYNSYTVGSGATEAALADSLQTRRATALLNQGSLRIPRQSYSDFYLAYRPNSHHKAMAAAFRNLEIAIGVQNVFNAEPPIIVSTSPTLERGYSTYGDPRLRRYTLSVSKQFN
jgi:hypothetical protein